jgi:hypothetical protein
MTATTSPLRAATLATTFLATLSLAGCAGEPPEAELPAEEPEAAAEASPPEGAAESGPTATIRLVNLWVDGGGGGTGASIDVTSKGMFTSEEALFEGVGFGEVTGTTTVPADVRLSVYRAGTVGHEEDEGGHFLTDTELEPGSVLTLVVSYHDPITEGGGTAGISIFYDTGPYVAGSMPVRPVDGVLLVASATPLAWVLGDDHEALTFGSPDGGCLRPAGSPAPGAGPGAITVSMGGTAAMTYDVTPGTVAVAAWGKDATSCGGAPRIGPIDVEVDAEGRTYVFAYGTGLDDLRLLTVPSSGGP